MTDDLYALLGVPKSVSKKKLREAYYTLVKKYHPDKNNGVHSEEFAKISVAYSILSNTKKRKLYDKTGTVDTFNLHSLAMQILADLFYHIIGDPHINVKTDDIIAKMVENITERIQMTHENIKSYEKVKERLKEVKSRITGKDAFFAQMVDSNLEQATKQIMIFQKDLEVGKNALEILKEYKYSIDERPGKFGLFSDRDIKGIIKQDFEEKFGETLSR